MHQPTSGLGPAMAQLRSVPPLLLKLQITTAADKRMIFSTTSLGRAAEHPPCLVCSLHRSAVSVLRRTRSQPALGAPSAAPGP